jgi:DNA (cytosine-5)-methyltransferase 1
VRDALPWIIKAVQDPKGQYAIQEASKTPAFCIKASSSGHCYVEAETDIAKYCTGKEWDKLKEGEQSDKYFSLVKVDRQKPCPTVCASHGSSGIASITHPTEKRKFSISELKRICAFPDDYILTGTYAQQWERMGRAVPPVMMSHIAETIRDNILKKICVE